MKKNINIYIVTHKKFDAPILENYLPIQVGIKNEQGKIYELSDNTDDNISYKNKNYCELTALYWIWKNDKKSDYVGMVHYRRYFYVKRNNSPTNILTYEKALNILENYDCILPKKWNLYFGNVLKNYDEFHNIDDYYKCREIISEMYPDYINSFDKISRQRKFYPFNMFIMKKELFDEYMEWLFNIFNKLESFINLEDYDDYNKRVYGFLSERLFNVWIDYNIKDIYELPVFRNDQTVFKQKINRVFALINYKIHKLYKNMFSKDG